MQLMSWGEGKPSPFFVGLSGNLRQTELRATKRLFRPDDVPAEARRPPQGRGDGGTGRQKLERLGGRGVGQGGGVKGNAAQFFQVLLKRRTRRVFP